MEVQVTSEKSFIVSTIFKQTLLIRTLFRKLIDFLIYHFRNLLNSPTKNNNQEYIGPPNINVSEEEEDILTKGNSLQEKFRDLLNYSQINKNQGYTDHPFNETDLPETSEVTTPNPLNTHVSESEENILPEGEVKRKYKRKPIFAIFAKQKFFALLDIS